MIKLNPSHDETKIHTAKEIRQQITATRQTLLDQIKHAQELPETFLNERAEAAAEKKDIKKASEIKSIIHIEIIKRIFQKIKQALQKQHGPYMTSLKTPKGINSVQEMWDMLKIRRENSSEWDEMYDPKKIEKLISNWCNTHFNQSSETPLTEEDWREIMIDSTQQEEILNVTFQPPTNNTETLEWFKAL